MTKVESIFNEVCMKLFEDENTERCDRTRIKDFIHKFLDTKPKIRRKTYKNMMIEDIIDLDRESWGEELLSWRMEGGLAWDEMTLAQQVLEFLQWNQWALDPEETTPEVWRNFLGDFGT